LQIQIYLSCIDSFISNKTTGSTIGAGTIFQFVAPAFIPYIYWSSCSLIFIRARVAQWVR